jgi:hypothetical protein
MSKILTKELEPIIGMLKKGNHTCFCLLSDKSEKTEVIFCDPNNSIARIFYEVVKSNETIRDALTAGSFLALVEASDAEKLANAICTAVEGCNWPREYKDKLIYTIQDRLL